MKAFVITTTDGREFTAEYPDDYNEDERLAYQAGLVAGIEIGLNYTGESMYRVRITGLDT